jgi:hypothetical protein
MSVASTLDSIVSDPITDSLRPNRRTARHFGCIDGDDSCKRQPGGTFLFINPL